MIGELRRRITKKLTCPACGAIVADATYRRWPSDLVIVSVDGHLVQPTGVALQIRIAEQEIAAAAGSPEQDAAEARLAYLRRNASELVYDLRCRNGHRVLQTMPQIVHRVRSSPGSWVTLR
jgi:hypothetical protein